MTRMKILLLVITGLFASSLWAQDRRNHGATTGENEINSEYVQDEFIVKFRAAVADQIRQSARSGVPMTNVGEIDALNTKYQVRSLERAFKSLDSPKAKIELAEKIGITRTYVLKVREGVDIKAAVAEYDALPVVEYAEPNYIDHITLVPDDPTYPDQWGLNNTGQAIPNSGGGTVGTVGADINAEAAWDITTGGTSDTIAILDSGVDYNHPDLAGRMVDGYDTFDDDTDPMDFTGHGTSCAGIAAATGNNGIGVAGVNWNCKIMPIKIGADGATTFSHQDGADGMVWAADNGAHILSCSYGGSDSQTKQDGVDYADSVGCTILASRGNNNTNHAFFPASYPNVIAVGALSPCNDRKTPTTCDGETWWGSSFGNDLDVMAPGTRIHTIDITGSGGYDDGDYTSTFNGTSAACPFAAGVAALVRSYAPGYTNDDIAEALRISAVDIGDEGYDNQTGFGRLNAFGALDYTTNSAPTAICQDVTVPADENCEGIVTALEVDNGSSDPDGDALVLELSPEGPYPLGETDVTLSVSDPYFTSTCTATITVVDQTAPVLTCPSDITVSNDEGECGAVVSFSVTATDNCDNNFSLSLSHSSGSFFPVGTTTVSATATDKEGNSSQCSFDITVEDNEAPEITTISDPVVLWPPNHVYVSFALNDLVESVSDNCASLSVSDIIISKVTSDEPEDGLGIGDGKTFDDIVISSDCQSVDVRRERGEELNGRVYTVHFAVADQDDNVGMGSCEIHVPIHPTQYSTDDGVVYQETGGCSYKSSPLTQQSNGSALRSAAYPNPFSEMSTVTFTVPQSGQTSVKVYSSSGQHISTLFDGTAEKDREYQLHFHATEFPEGIYFYRVQAADGNSITKKLILLR